MTAIQTVASKPLPPSQLQPQIPPELEPICLKCLEKLERDRYQTANALADDLDRFLQGNTSQLAGVVVSVKRRLWCRWGEAAKMAETFGLDEGASMFSLLKSPLTWAVAALALMPVAIVVWIATSSHISEDDLGEDDQGPSVDLPTDLKLMWQTQQLRGTPDPSHGTAPRASTDAAIKAASRVFGTVSLLGLAEEDVIAKIGHPRTSNDSIYNFPFYPIKRGVMIYRFDTGSYGWQFNIYFDSAGRVRKLQRLAIE